MHGASNEASGTVSLPWLVIRQDDNGNRYRVGRYATRNEAQKITEGLDARGHRQLYWVEDLGRGDTGPSGSTPDSGRDIVRGHTSGIRRSLGQIQPPAEESTDSVGEEPTHCAEDRTGQRRLQRARPLFEALAHILPADARDRWCEEWMAEWVDLGEQPLRMRVAWLLRVILRGGPSCAWTLRFGTRRQRVQ